MEEEEEEGKKGIGERNKKEREDGIVWDRKRDGRAD